MYLRPCEVMSKVNKVARDNHKTSDVSELEFEQSHLALTLN